MENFLDVKKVQKSIVLPTPFTLIGIVMKKIQNEFFIMVRGKNKKTILRVISKLSNISHIH